MLKQEIAFLRKCSGEVGISGASPVPSVTATNVSLNETPLLATDPVSSVKLLYDNQERLSNMPADYFTLIQPFYTAVSIPQLTGYHLYSYSLDLVSTDPKGSTNYGKLAAVQLLLNQLTSMVGKNRDESLRLVECY